MRKFFSALLLCFFSVYGDVADSIIPQLNQLKHEAGNGPALRIMTYNMLYNVANAERKLPEKHRWPQRMYRLAEYLQFSCPDLIGSQELQERQIQDLMALIGNVYACYGEKTREKEGRTDTNAIFYNPYRLQLVEGITVPFGNQTGGNAFTYCTFYDRYAHRTMSVVNFKLTYGLTWEPIKKRKLEAVQLAQFVNRLPQDHLIIVLGDFNIIPFLDGEAIPQILAKAFLQDSRNLTSLVFGPACSSTNSIFLTPFTGPEITGLIPDRIFVKNNGRVLSCGIDPGRVDGEFPSDHLPVIIDME